MNNYEEGKEYFLKGTARAGDSLGWSVEFFYNNGIGKSCGKLSDDPGLLLTAEEVAQGADINGLCKELAAENVAHIETIQKQGKDIENLERAIEELQKERTALEEANEVLKNQKDGLIKQIEKHEATIEERTIECNRWEGMYDKASKRCDELQKTCEDDTTVAIDLANQRDNLKRKYEAALKDLAQKDEACEKLKRQWDEALKDKDDLQKALEALNKDIDEYRATIQKLSSIIGFLCGTKGGQNA